MPTSSRPPRARRYTLQSDLHPDLKTKKLYYQNFMTGPPPILYTVSATTGAAALQTSPTTINTVAKMLVPGSSLLWDYYSTTAQTNMLVSTAASGLEISGDELDNETLELVPGENAADNPLSQVVGTDNDFYFKARFKFTDASGSDQFGIGWRKQEAFAVPTSFLSGGASTYTDNVLFGFAGTTADPNPVRISTSVGSAVSVVTAASFTWADAKVHTLEIRVVGGKPIFLINGVRLGNPLALDGLGVAITSQTTTSGPSYTFTAALRLIPFIFLRHDADVANETYLQEVEIGHLVAIGLDPNAE